MIASASTIHHDIGPHQKSSGSARAAQQEEARDETDVRRVERVRPAELDDVLREERAAGGRHEDRPAAHRPPVAVHGARHAEHERHAVPCQQRAGRPHQDALVADRQRDLDHRARAEAEEDLRDRDPERERRLSEHLERRDRRREVEAGVPQLGEDDRVGRPADRDGRHPPPI
jgi:hypothetical protein